MDQNQLRVDGHFIPNISHSISNLFQEEQLVSSKYTTEKAEIEVTNILAIQEGGEMI